MLVEKDRVVTLTYQLFSLGTGQEPVLLEERSVDDPLDFIFGRDVLLAKVEDSIAGQSPGFEKQLDLDPRDAYGLHQADLQAWIEKSKFPKDFPLELGMKFQTQGPQGGVISVIVKEIQDAKVLVDGNHPLAGLNIRFEYKVLRVREASEQELTTGEVNPSHLH